MMKKFHYYYYLNPSIWPFLTSFMTFNLMTSLLIFFKYKEYYFFFFNFILTILISLFWWMTFKNECNMKGASSFLYENGVKLSMILFISSEIFFFFSFFWSYFHFFLSPSLEVGLSWPPMNLMMFNFLNLPLINTLILVSSGLTLTVSHFNLSEGNKKMCSISLMTTILLGLLFSFFQFMEYKNSFFMINDANFGSSFFLLTGFHGIHVIIGFIFLFFIWLNMASYPYSPKSFMSFELASWYWHFVDVVWMFLFYFLYYISS